MLNIHRVTTFLILLTMSFVSSAFASPDTARGAEVQTRATASPPPVLRLSLNEAIAVFLRQNFDLIISNFGIDTAKGQQITARLFPNPSLLFNTQASFTQ